MIYITLVLTAVVISSSQAVMKYTAMVHRDGHGVTDPRFLLPLIFGFLLSVSAQLVWLWTLQFVPLGKGFMILSLTFVFVPLISFRVFNEPLSPSFVVGVMLVVVGIALTVRA